MRHLASSLAFLTLLGGTASAGNSHVITSPDARARVTLTEVAGELHCSLNWQGQDILRPSRMDLLDGGKLEIVRVTTNQADRVWKPVWGQFSRIRDRHRELVLHLKHGAEQLRLECRVFDDGVGLRFTSGGKPLAAVKKVNFRTEYRWPEQSGMYWPNGEKEPVGPVSVAEFARSKNVSPRTPVVVDAGGGVFAAVLESDLFSAKQFSALRFGRSNSTEPVLTATAAAVVAGKAWRTPWRVVLIGRSPGDLLVSTTPLNLAAECVLPDTAWIKPGKAMWDWRVHGYTVDGFRYGINTASYLRFIDFAATYNIQYFLIDDAWFTSAKQGKLEASSEIDLPRIMARARERGVGVLLYYDRRKGVLEDDVLFPQLAGLGAAGVKYGFMGNKADFTRRAIAAAARQKLLIDFHDGPCPMTGVERTLPNFVTREYCHAQQDARRAFTPTAFLKMAMINALTGPLDQANGAFGLNGINRGERAKGPRIRESYNATVVSETARVLVISSGLICLPDAPEEYAEKADLFAFIRRMPTTWDETRILNSRIGASITTARRSGRAWFVGSVINEAGGELAIPLDFLAPDTRYDVTYYEDAPDSHYVTNREAYRIRHGTVKRGDTIQARLAPGGGHCLWIRPHSQTTQQR